MRALILAAFVLLPPIQYRGGGLFLVQTRSPEATQAYCRAWGVDAYACTLWGVVNVPGPCAWPSDQYARLLCHEMAHANGWPGDHPN